MSKLIISLIVGMMLLTLVVAGGLLTTADLKLKDTTEPVFVKTNNITIVGLTITEIDCIKDKKYCSSCAYQSKLIDDCWRIDNTNMKLADMIILRDTWVKNRLDNYAQVQATRFPDKTIGIEIIKDTEPIEEPLEEVII